MAENRSQKSGGLNLVTFLKVFFPLSQLFLPLKSSLLGLELQNWNTNLTFISFVHPCCFLSLYYRQLFQVILLNIYILTLWLILLFFKNKQSWTLNFQFPRALFYPWKGRFTVLAGSIQLLLSPLAAPVKYLFYLKAYFYLFSVLSPLF